MVLVYLNAPVWFAYSVRINVFVMNNNIWNNFATRKFYDSGNSVEKQTVSRGRVNDTGKNTTLLGL